MTTEKTEFLTVAEVARTLRVSRNTIYRLVANAQLPALKLGSGPNPSIRIPKVELDRYTATARIGNDIAREAEQLLARRGEDPDDPELYAEALRELGYAAAIFADKVERAVHA